MSRRKELEHKLEVAAPADDVWAVYSSPDLPRLIVELLPGVFERIDVIRGDGGIGTVLKLVYPPGSEPIMYKEKFITIDHKKRLKEVLQISDGYLELGCSFYMDSFEILETGPKSCIIISKTTYELDPTRPDNASHLITIDGLVPMAKAIAKYVLKKNGKEPGNQGNNSSGSGSGRKELVHDLEVAAPADDVWAVYSSPDLPRLIVQLLPGVFERIDVIRGDGGLGTVLKLVYPPGSEPIMYKEKFVTIDHKKRLKEVQQISDGYLELGCSFYMDSFEILEKGPKSCIIRSKTTYELDPTRPDNASHLISIDGLVPMAEAIAKYVLKKNGQGDGSGSGRKELVHDLEVAAPADDVWAVYSSPDLPRLIIELLPGVFERIDVVRGNGGIGTVLKLVFPPGSVPLTYKEKFVTIDDQKRLKEVLQISGGYLELGCSFYMDSFEILQKGPKSCIIRSKTTYEIDPTRPDNASHLISIDGLVPMAEAIAKYVLKKNGGSGSGNSGDGSGDGSGGGRGRGHSGGSGDRSGRGSGGGRGRGRGRSGGSGGGSSCGSGGNGNRRDRGCSPDYDSGPSGSGSESGPSGSDSGSGSDDCDYDRGRHRGHHGW